MTLARLALLFLLAVTDFARAQTGIPAAINYQGTLTDNLGNPATNGYYQVQFRVWDHPTLNGAGDYVWGRSFPLYVATNGMFNVLLSDDGGLVSDPGAPEVTNILSAFTSPDRYLGLTVTANPRGSVPSPTEISPRQRLVSAPYAVHAQDATTASLATNALNLAGITATQYVTRAVFPPLLGKPNSILSWNSGLTATNSGFFDYNGKFLITTARSAPTEPASGVALQVTGGAIRPSVGASTNAGIYFPENPGGGGGDAAWMRYYSRSGDDCSLQIGITNDPGDNLELVASGNVSLQAGSELSLSGVVRALGAWTRLKVGTDLAGAGYTFKADRDGFVTLHAYNVNANYNVNGSGGTSIMGNDVYCQGSTPGNMTVITLPLAKDESITYKVTSTGSGSWNAWIGWRPFGR